MVSEEVIPLGFRCQVSGVRPYRCQVSALPLVPGTASLIEKETYEHRTSNVGFHEVSNELSGTKEKKFVSVNFQVSVTQSRWTLNIET